MVGCRCEAHPHHWQMLNFAAAPDPESSQNDARMCAAARRLAEPQSCGSSRGSRKLQRRRRSTASRAPGALPSRSASPATSGVTHVPCAVLCLICMTFLLDKTHGSSLSSTLQHCGIGKPAKAENSQTTAHSIALQTASNDTLLLRVTCNDLGSVTRQGTRGRRKPGTGATQSP
jgi:hypothetical protein